MPDYAILRIKKQKGPCGPAVAIRHNLRDRETPNADPSKTPSNTYLVGEPTTAAIMAAWRARMATVDRKVRKDAVTAVEYVITASSPAFKSEKLNDGYFQKALKWVAERHGQANIIQAVVHRDERTPHLHVLVVPIHQKTAKYTHKSTKETTERSVNALDAKHWFHGKEAMQEMQDSFFEAVGSPYGLTRGIKGSRARHEEIQSFYARSGASGSGSRPQAHTSPTKTQPQTPEWVSVVLAAEASGDGRAASQAKSGAKSMLTERWLFNAKESGKVSDTGLIGNRRAIDVAKAEADAYMEAELAKYRERPRGDVAPRGKPERERGRGDGAGWDE